MVVGSPKKLVDGHNVVRANRASVYYSVDLKPVALHVFNFPVHHLEREAFRRPKAAKLVVLIDSTVGLAIVVVV